MTKPEWKQQQDRDFIYTDIMKGTKRIAVTAEWLWEKPDVTGYLFNAESDEFSLDPWTTIGGVDRRTDDGSYYLEYGNCSEKRVFKDYTVYVSEKDFERAGA